MLLTRGERRALLAMEQQDIVWVGEQMSGRTPYPLTPEGISESMVRRVVAKGFARPGAERLSGTTWALVLTAKGRAALDAL
ncbi:hypothetical protein Cwoe_4055 [Conexibacter woesei DSM 14684]|uniref:Uncharacterized protein n=1 Tax=Conexibacter woesei (strain DSM 14684 / CCUG 47730 / CIP 108061 / JCM 11494 / NBRC 100937 / ID131577) TaxID=469383 RepID=D3F4L5_CONWI|nr:hypothetical protein Cwoe_4055 [Conexibacter woesei DSM 14684]